MWCIKKICMVKRDQSITLTSFDIYRAKKNPTERENSSISKNRYIQFPMGLERRTQDVWLLQAKHASQLHLLYVCLLLNTTLFFLVSLILDSCWLLKRKYYSCCSIIVPYELIDRQIDRQTDRQRDRQALFKHDENKSYAAYGVVH